MTRAVVQDLASFQLEYLLKYCATESTKELGNIKTPLSVLCDPLEHVSGEVLGVLYAAKGLGVVEASPRFPLFGSVPRIKKSAYALRMDWQRRRIRTFPTRPCLVYTIPHRTSSGGCYDTRYPAKVSAHLGSEFRNNCLCDHLLSRQSVFNPQVRNSAKRSPDVDSRDLHTQRLPSADVLQV